ncbi:hypothetical protein EBZ39_14410 [bacterium]|nr:hypothetical protein [bacterium]
MSTKAATFASKSQRAMGLGDTPSCAKLGVQNECSYKTIQRDIDLLRDFFGYPLEYDKAKYVYKLAGPLPKAVL